MAKILIPVAIIGGILITILVFRKIYNDYNPKDMQTQIEPKEQKTLFDLPSEKDTSPIQATEVPGHLVHQGQLFVHAEPTVQGIAKVKGEIAQVQEKFVIDPPSHHYEQFTGATYRDASRWPGDYFNYGPVVQVSTDMGFYAVGMETEWGTVIEVAKYCVTLRKPTGTTHKIIHRTKQLPAFGTLKPVMPTVQEGEALASPSDEGTPLLH